MNTTELSERQRTLFRSGATRPIDFRIKQLQKLKQLIKQNEASIFAALQQDLHKSNFEAYATEVAPVLEEIDLACKHLKKWSKTKSTSVPLALRPGSGKIISEPFGVVCIFAPWNYPFTLLLSPAIGSMAAGNCTILKPAELTSHTQTLILKLINDNFDPGYLFAVGGGIPECEQLLEQKFDYIFFTGSPRVGRIIMSAAAKHLTPVCLELGGKSPCIVDKTANLEVAAKRICWAKFLNAGQTCAAPDYIYVHESIEEKFLHKCTQIIGEFFGDDPKASDYFGRLVGPVQFDRISKLIDENKLHFGGKVDRDSLYISPTILRNVTWDDPAMQEEIFGPIMPVMKFNDLSVICDEISSRPKPLALYIYSESKKIQDQVLNSTTSGGGCVNDCIVHVGNPQLPFGGVGESGMGSYHGKRSFETLSHQRSIQYSSTRLDNPLRYPPYSERMLKWLKRIF